MTKRSDSSKTSDSDERVRAFKAGLAAIRRRTGFISYRGSGAYASRLRGLLGLLDDGLEPRKGLELVAAFYRADAAVFEACDDSDGTVGDVFRMDARDRFTAYATRCADKDWVADLVFELLEDDDYGVRDSVLDHAADYFPEEVLRALAEREWQAAESIIPLDRSKRDHTRDHRIILVQLMARGLNDARLFERAARAYNPELGTAACIHIAQVWLAAGDPATTLTWLERVNPGTTFMAHERDEALAEVFRQLGRGDDLEAMAWRRFRASRSLDTLDALVRVAGPERRDEAVAEAVGTILREPSFDAGDAQFLLETERITEATEYVIKRQAQIDGDFWSSLLPLIRGFEAVKQHLAATVIYRALLDSILARAQTRTYGHGARYLYRLEQLAGLVADWAGVTPHVEYLGALRSRHARKSSFWSRAGG